MNEPLCNHFGPLMGYCDHQLHKLMFKELQSYDVSPVQCRVLMYLYDQGGQADQKKVQDNLMVRASTVNGVVERLEEKGMIVRTVKPTDARVRVLQLTDEGRRFHDAFAGIEEKLHTQMERGFTEEELAQLRRFLQRVAANLKTEDKEC